MSTVIGNVKCSVCELGADVKESGSGTLSVLCKNPSCKSQVFIKAPSAVAAMKKKLGIAPAAAEPAPAAAPAEAGGGAPKKRKSFFVGL